MHRVRLRHRANERKLPCWPPFGVPNLIQPNWVVPPVVYIVDPVLGAVVTGEILGVVVGHPISILLPPRGMIQNFREQAVSAHHFSDKPIIPGAMDVEWDALHVLTERLRKTERFPLEVFVDLIARTPLGPIFSLFD